MEERSREKSCEEVSGKKKGGKNEGCATKEGVVKREKEGKL